MKNIPLRNPPLTLARRLFAQYAPLSSQKMLFVIFALLLLLVVIGCTFGPTPALVLIVGGGLALLMLALRHPQIALLTVSLGATFPSWRPVFAGHQAHVVEFGLALCLLCVLVWRPSVRLGWPHLFACSFVFLSCISFIHVPEISSGKAYGADKRLQVILIMYLAFFCGTFLMRFIKDIPAVLCLFLFSNIPLFAIALAQLVHFPLPTWAEASQAQNPALSLGRLWGPSLWPSVFGMYLVNLYALALVCWCFGRRRWQQVTGVLFIIASLGGIVGSGTRSALLVAVGITILVLWVTRRFKLLALLALAAVIVLVLAFPKIAPRFEHGEDSISNRFLLWQLALTLVLAHPLLGVGLGQFRLYYGQLIVNQATHLDTNNLAPHQQYLQWAVESGLLAFIAGTGFLIALLLAYRRVYRSATPGQQALLLAAALMVLANMGMGFVDIPLDQVEGPVLLFLLLGLALGCAEQVRRRLPNPGAERHILLHSAPGIPGSALSGKRAVHLLSSSVQHISAQLKAIQVTDSHAAYRPNARKTSRTILIQIVGWGIAIPIIFPVTALLTRYLGPVQYGEYTFAFTYITLFSLLSGTGMDALLIRQLSLSPRARWGIVLGEAVGTRVLSTVLSSLVLFAVTFFLPVAQELRVLLFFGGTSLLFSFSVNCLRFVYTCGFRAEQRVELVTVLETVNRLVTAGLLVIVVLCHISLIWAYVLVIYSDLPAFLFLARQAHRRYRIHWRFNILQALILLKKGGPLTFYDLLNFTAGQADLLLLMALSSSVGVGFFALAMRLTDPLQAVIHVYVNGLYPLLCVAFEQGKARFELVCREALRALTLLMTPFVALGIVYAPAIVEIFGGASFAPATGTVQLLLGSLLMTFFAILATRMCMAANLERRIPLVTGVTLVFNLLANLVLIPRWQWIGAGVASLASETLSMLLFFMLLRKALHLPVLTKTVLRVALGNLPALVFLLWQRHVPILVVGPAFLGISIVGCLIVRAVSWHDVRELSRFLLEKGRRQTVPVSPS